MRELVDVNLCLELYVHVNHSTVETSDDGVLSWPRPRRRRTLSRTMCQAANCSRSAEAASIRVAANANRVALASCVLQQPDSDQTSPTQRTPARRRRVRMSHRPRGRLLLLPHAEPMSMNDHA